MAEFQSWFPVSQDSRPGMEFRFKGMICVRACLRIHFSPWSTGKPQRKSQFSGVPYLPILFVAHSDPSHPEKKRTFRALRFWSSAATSVVSSRLHPQPGHTMFLAKQKHHKSSHKPWQGRPLAAMIFASVCQNLRILVCPNPSLTGVEVKAKLERLASSTFG